MSERFVVQVDADQFDKLARPSMPIAGVAELIWNALDAEAETVEVVIQRTELDAVDEVVVTDNGHGMTHEDALRDFKRLGGSWKKGRTLSKHGKRSMHGKEGAGRFRAFAIGSTVEWSSVARSNDGGLERTLVSGSMDSSEFTVGDAEPLATGEPGTVVSITRPREHANRLLGDTAAMHLLAPFAVNLLKYPDVKIIYDGQVLDPSTIIDREEEIPLRTAAAPDSDTPTLKIIEWKPEAKEIKPSLLLCDENGVVLHEVTDGIDSAPEIRYTAYVAWRGFDTYADTLVLADLDTALIPVIDAAREAIRSYLDGRLTEQRAQVIARWKAARVYPYAGEPVDAVEAQERKVFDALAATAAPAIAKEQRAAKLSLRLIKEALGQPPGALHRVLTEVLELTPEQLADFDKLLERTTLPAIHTSKVITGRLDFLADLESLLFDHEKKARLLERRELHRIIANGRTWVFGEQYALAVDDRGLTAVLEAHRALLGDDAHLTAPVTDTEGHTRIVDLMLSRAMHAAHQRQHLVVELKRPKLKLTQTELNQIANYAVAVSRDERFKAPDVSWDFWLLGDDMDEIVQELANRKDQPEGLYTEGGSYRIWVRRWAEVLEENRQRLHFYRDHLEYQPAEADELQEVLTKYLPQTEIRSAADAATAAT